ncbi:MAG: (Fe-S)-binding protein [Chitinophagaceae bacterium]|nr:(Fe-S)-binding protein [Chitinophagaceae bacterium]
MTYLQQTIFTIILITALFLFTRKTREIAGNIRLGREEDYSDRPADRWKNLLLLAFGQKKMFRKPVVAVLHFIIYAGFLIINIEVLEIILDGILGTHRLFSSALEGFYTFVINFFEFFAAGVLIGCVVFLIRRNIIGIKRLRSRDLDGWPRSDANYILITEIILMTLLLTMNATDTLLQQRGYQGYAAHNTGNFMVSSLLHPLLNGFSNGTLHNLERTAWWMHIAGILAFLNYLPYSKHLHIILAFPNAYFTRLEPKGKMKNMASVQNEVLYAMQPELAPAETEPPQKFGARDIFDLSWKNLMDAYSCTECGRCSAACPATQTGKLLSPRKIMMDTRDRMEEVRKNITTNGSFIDDGKTLLYNYITTEELRACTTCNACVEECPVSISPLEIILDLRRALIMENSDAPPEWNAMNSNIENNFAPWKFNPEERDQWMEGVK